MKVVYTKKEFPTEYGRMWIVEKDGEQVGHVSIVKNTCTAYVRGETLRQNAVPHKEPEELEADRAMDRIIHYVNTTEESSKDEVRYVKNQLAFIYKHIDKCWGEWACDDNYVANSIDDLFTDVSEYVMAEYDIFPEPK